MQIEGVEWTSAPGGDTLTGLSSYVISNDKQLQKKKTSSQAGSLRCATILYPWLGVSANYGSEISRTIIMVIGFARNYCVSCENNVNTRPNLKTDTRLVGIPI